MPLDPSIAAAKEKVKIIIKGREVARYKVIANFTQIVTNNLSCEKMQQIEAYLNQMLDLDIIPETIEELEIQKAAVDALHDEKAQITEELSHFKQELLTQFNSLKEKQELENVLDSLNSDRAKAEEVIDNLSNYILDLGNHLLKYANKIEVLRKSEQDLIKEIEELNIILSTKRKDMNDKIKSLEEKKQAQTDAVNNLAAEAQKLNDSNQELLTQYNLIF